ncbi:hypothetical protein BKA69DRAFT_1039974 [Paraphysoderma sedebokerense]|nr:hypothetical protein BKA69DRAFT_1039970 [Paraphysoderma sedebokerense]KAI9139577.1 hypothetical protein BKA69DRAFT_1039974 [Paraphysoderma sedebokerense]
MTLPLVSVVGVLTGVAAKSLWLDESMVSSNLAVGIGLCVAGMVGLIVYSLYDELEHCWGNCRIPPNWRRRPSNEEYERVSDSDGSTTVDILEREIPSGYDSQEDDFSTIAEIPSRKSSPFSKSPTHPHRQSYNTFSTQNQTTTYTNIPAISVNSAPTLQTPLLSSYSSFPTPNANSSLTQFSYPKTIAGLLTAIISGMSFAVLYIHLYDFSNRYLPNPNSIPPLIAPITVASSPDSAHFITAPATLPTILSLYFYSFSIGILAISFVLYLVTYLATRYVCPLSSTPARSDSPFPSSQRSASPYLTYSTQPSTSPIAIPALITGLLWTLGYISIIFIILYPLLSYSHPHPPPHIPSPSPVVTTLANINFNIASKATNSNATSAIMNFVTTLTVSAIWGKIYGKEYDCLDTKCKWTVYITSLVCIMVGGGTILTDFMGM